jgi:hypothetical protein
MQHVEKKCTTQRSTGHEEAMHVRCSLWMCVNEFRTEPFFFKRKGVLDLHGHVTNTLRWDFGVLGLERGVVNLGPLVTEIIFTFRYTLIRDRSGKCTWQTDGKFVSIFLLVHVFRAKNVNAEILYLEWDSQQQYKSLRMPSFHVSHAILH